MSIFEVQNLTFKYPMNNKMILDNISFTVNEGDFIVLCGASGSGKTTLLRHLKPCLAPRGERGGVILFHGKDLDEVSDLETAEKIGYVMQDAQNQIVTDKVWHELAFGLENLGIESSEIRRRVAEMACFFGIEKWFHKSVHDLSGGQKQLLNLASVMLMKPEVIILDEPSSQLDPIAGENFFNMLYKINREIGTAIVLSEHSLENVVPMCSRLAVMDGGKIICDDIPSRTGKFLFEKKHIMFDDMPSAIRISGGRCEEYPLSVKQGRVWLRNYAKTHRIGKVEVRDDLPMNEIAAELRDVYFGYSFDDKDVICGASLKINKGEILSIVGGNGSGKTTLISLLGGLYAPYRGKVYIDGKPINKINGLYENLLGILPQNPKNLFVKKNVSEDLRDVCEDWERIERVASLCGLTGLMNANPFDLSGGEQQRAALAKVLLKNPKILILDEPTKGMNHEYKSVIGRIFKRLQKAGVTIVMVSHDIEFCAEYSDRCAMLFDGTVTSVCEIHEFFMKNNLYTTAARRIGAGIADNAVTVEEVKYALGENVIEAEGNTDFVLADTEERCEKKVCKKNCRGTNGQKKISTRTRFAVLMIVLMMPLTIFAGMYFLEDRKYYFISLLVLLEAMLPFAMIYENRKPNVRELVIIAVMCALGVAGRTAFYAVPNFKPLAAIIILTGAALGGEAGFLVGAMSAFVSNFQFGQGPWTPWQMFAFGIVGFLGGVLFHKEIIPKKRMQIAIYGGLSIMLVYGPIMDLYSAMMTQAEMSIGTVLTSMMLGLQFNIIHAVSTIIFLWIISNPLLNQFERMKIKYGIYD